MAVPALMSAIMEDSDEIHQYPSRVALARHATRGPCLGAYAQPEGGSAQKAIARLLSEKLVEEIRSRGELPVWRRDEKHGPRTLRITKRGLAAIGAEDDEPAEPKEQRDRKLLKADRRAKAVKSAPEKSLGARTRNKADGVAALDWHFVDLVWIVLFALIYLPRRT